jgi:hypothetical protein
VAHWRPNYAGGPRLAPQGRTGTARLGKHMCARELFPGGPDCGSARAGAARLGRKVPPSFSPPAACSPPFLALCALPALESTEEHLNLAAKHPEFLSRSRPRSAIWGDRVRLSGYWVRFSNSKVRTVSSAVTIISWFCGASCSSPEDAILAQPGKLAFNLQPSSWMVEGLRCIRKEQQPGGPVPCR